MTPKRRHIVQAVLALPALSLLASWANAQKPVEGKFLHHVYFWLTDPDSPAARKGFLAELNKMRAIPGIRYSFIAAPSALKVHAIGGDLASFERLHLCRTSRTDSASIPHRRLAKKSLILPRELAGAFVADLQGGAPGVQTVD